MLFYVQEHVWYGNEDGKLSGPKGPYFLGLAFKDCLWACNQSPLRSVRAKKIVLSSIFMKLN